MARKVKSDIEMSGGMGFYTAWGTTSAGLDWLDENLFFEDWQGSSENGISIDDTRYAQEIADAAVSEGLRVIVNGIVYKPIAA